MKYAVLETNHGHVKGVSFTIGSFMILFFMIGSFMILFILETVNM